MMRSNQFCDRELCLVSPAPYTRVESIGIDVPQEPVQLMRDQKAITVFYGGQICSCDVTEIQARAIICMAKRETERAKRESSHSSQQDHHDHHYSLMSSSSLLFPQLLDVEGLSMKKSLQWFLQRRKKTSLTRYHDSSRSSSSSCN